MTDYIDREALINAIATSTEPFTTGLVFRAINNQPAADVAPVRRGQWLDLRGDYQTAKCSFCASQYEVTFGEESNGMLFDCFKRSYKYCPNCGAKMEAGNG